jgi:cytoskeleton protein RodZ
MIEDSDTPISAEEAPQGASAGTRLRKAREAAGMSIDAVAQQLKLAPRQVKALEEDDFAQLPGRTFVRGFLRNYARLVRLDADEVLATLPDANAAPSLDRPLLAPTTRMIGELPADMPGKPSNARWAIPLALAAIATIAIVYEYARPLAEQARSFSFAKSTSAPSAPAPNPAASTTENAPSPPAPVDNAAPADAASMPVSVASPAIPTGDMPLVFVFRGTSWIEVRDAKGAVVLSTIGYPGATHAVGGTPPLEVVLGNAEAVAVTWRGATFDVTPYVRQNVAKFSLK